MKRIALFLSLVLVLILGACKLPAPDGGVRPALVTLTPTSPTGIGEATPTTGAGEPIADQPLPTATNPPAVTNTSPPPTNTPLPPTATSQPAADVQSPTRTSTPAGQPAVAFDPYTAYGKPKYQNDMVVANLPEWAPPETRVLPDNEDIKLVFKDGKLYVTGKQREFSTWWFSYHFAEDFYLEMTFDTESCSGNDAYGMIIRGPEHLAGLSYGYVIAFTCDGKVWVFRLDGIDPWDAEDLVDEYPSGYVKAGSDKVNTMGVRADGDELSIVVNGYLIETVRDDEYSKGRFGVFVRAVDTEDYTFRVNKFAYWILGE